MEKLLALLSQEGGFFKWGIAAGILWWISTRKEIGAVGSGLIALIVLILAMKIASDPTILAGVSKVWSALPDPVAKKI